MTTARMPFPRDPRDTNQPDHPAPDNADVVDLRTARRHSAETDTPADTRPVLASETVPAPPHTRPDSRADRGPDIPRDTLPATPADTIPDTIADRGPDTTSVIVRDTAGDGEERPRAHRQVLPSWARSWDALAGLVAQRTSQAARATAFHALRLPMYWLRLALRSPRGVWRIVWFTWQWATDINGRLVRRSVAYGTATGAPEAQAFHRVSEQHRERVKYRLIVLAGATILALLVIRRAWLDLPTWQFTALTALVAAGIGALHRDPTHPVVSSFAAADTAAPRLTTELITAACGVLGIAELNKALRNGEPIRFLAPGVHRDGPGWRADVDLPGGVTAGDVIERRDRLASGLRRPVSCVWPEPDPDVHEARLVLWVADKPMAKAKPKPWPLLTRGRVNLFDAFPIGTDQRGRPVTLTLMFASMIIGAVPRMGKTFALRLILLAAALDTRAELHIYDLKGGADLRSLGMVAHRFRIGEDDEDLAYLLDDLRALKTDMIRRYKVIRDLPETICPEGKVSPDLAARTDLRLHPVVLAIDECQTLFEHPVFGAEAVDIVEDLVKKGPAVAITAILATQRPDAKSIPKGVSANAVLRFCLKVTEQTANDMVLGTSMYKAGVRATMFARNDKGVGYLVGEGADPQIVRFSFIDGPTAKTTAHRARTLRTTAGTLTGHAAGLDIEVTTDEPTPTILDDLAHVIPATEQRIWSETLLEHLSAFKPDVYTGWTPTDLGNALTPHGIETIQIGRRINGKVINRKGIDRTHIHTAITERDQRRGQ